MKKLALISMLLVAGAASAAPKKEAAPKETKKDPMAQYTPSNPPPKP